MVRLSRGIRHLVPCVVMLCALLFDAARFLRCCLRSPAALAAENLFLRKQLALYQARHVKPRHATNAIRVALVWLSQWFDWPQALTVVQPETFRRWRHQGLPRFRPRTSCPGRPPIPAELQRLIRQMARDNLTWGQQRMANELRLKLGLQVSPRTVRKYMSTRFDRAPGQRVPAQRWRTFLRNHAWDLITSGVAADLTRGRPAFLARIIAIVQWWWNRAVASRW
jgi:putative transposase